MASYSDEFREKVIEFARSNTNFVTRQKFMIPDSTLRFVAFNFCLDLRVVNRVWLKQAGLEGRRLCQNGDNEEEEEKGQGRDQDSASSSHEAETTNYTDCTNRLPFTKEFRSAVLDDSKRRGLQAASDKFGVAMEDLRLWTRRAGKRLTRDIPEESKRSIVEWGVQVNSWKLAARKYQVHPSTVGLWAGKFKLKLRPGGMIRDENTEW